MDVETGLAIVPAGTLRIPVTTPSLNEIIRQCNWKRSQERQRLGFEILVANREVGIGAEIPVALDYEVRAIGIRQYRERLLDRDNFVGGLKPLIDALRDNRMIFNDDPDHLITIETVQEKNTDKYKNETHITIGTIKDPELRFKYPKKRRKR